MDRTKQLLKESSLFNNYFNSYTGFSLFPKGKLSLKFTMPYVKFHETKNPFHHARNFLNAMTLKGTETDIFYIIFPYTFDKDAVRWYNTIDL